MELELKNKIILVTGGAGIEGSIGHTIVFALADEGAIPIILDRNERGYKYEKQLKKSISKARFFQTDLSKPEDIKTSIEKITKEFSGIDVIINNVGVNDGASLESSMEKFISSLHLNLISYYATVKYAMS